MLGSVASASNLGQFDTRSMAMGGAGVAGANVANSAAFNPALIASNTNKRSFSLLFPAFRADGFNENEFIDGIEQAENIVNANGTGLNDLLDGFGTLAFIEGGDPRCASTTGCYTDPNMSNVAERAIELTDQLTELNKSSLLVNANAGIAVQFGKALPMALIVDAGVIGSFGLKAANSDTNELNSYFETMQNGEISLDDRQTLIDLDLITLDDNNDIEFNRGSDEGSELNSLLEVIGATYGEVGISLADSFHYRGKQLAVGITPKIVTVKAVKYHQSVEENGAELSDVDDNALSRTDFNADVGITFQPLDTQKLQVGVAVKNLFSRSYNLNKSDIEIELEQTARNGIGAAALAAQEDLDAFAFRQRIKIEPQITAGLSYQLPFINFLADIDLNAAEVLGRESQYISLGTEFDVRLVKLQLGYRTSIGGNDEDDALSAGFSLGILGVAAIYSGDQVGVAAQVGFSF